MRIFGWLADHAGCGWYRLLLPLGALQDQGVQTEFNGRMPPEVFHGEGWDVVIGQRIFLRGPSAGWQDMAARPSRPLLVYEVDDDLFAVEKDNPAYETYADEATRRNVRRNMEVADLVTVSTEPLAEQVAKINPRVAVLPNCIPSELLRWRHGWFDDRFTVGWQGSPTHNADWATITRTIGSWFKQTERWEHPVEMHTIGALPKSFPRLPRHRHSDWTKHIPQYYMTVDWHVALAPLVNNQFNRSKSDLRVLEAAMLGVPTIAADVPAYGGVPGYAVTRASSPREWREALTEYLNDPQTAQVAGVRARDWAQTRTIEANAQRWLQAYEKAISG